MPPRPLHRWKTFWLGILVLVFLGWGWVRSRKHDDSLNVTFPRLSLHLAHEPGCIRIGYMAAKSAAWRDEINFISIPSAGSWVDGEFRPGDFGPWFPHWRRWCENQLPGKAYGKGIYPPYWLLILLFLVPWAGFLIWRVRRVKRFAPGSAEPPARSST